MDRETSQYINDFLEIGLTEREAKVYMMLLTKRMFTAAELQETVNIPRTKIYEVLQKMINRGICVERRIGRNKIFEAVEPKIAFGQIFEDYETKLNRRKELIKGLTEVFTPLYEENKEIMNPLDYIEVLTDQNQTQKRYIYEVHNTKREFLTFNKGPYVCDSPEKLKEQEDVEKKLLKRGGKCKNIYEAGEIRNLNWLIDYVKEQKKYGQEARVVETLPIKMLISDEKIVMFPLEGPHGKSKGITFIIIKHNALAKACRVLFQHYWEQGKDIDDLNID